MKRHLLLALCGLLLASCGQEATQTPSAQVTPVKTEAPAPVGETGSGTIKESVTDRTGTGYGNRPSAESGSWRMAVGAAENFGIDDYLEKGTYSIVQKFEKNWYAVLTVDPTTNTGVLNNTIEPSSCQDYGSSHCVNFILKDKKIIYANLKGKFSHLNDRIEDIGWVFKLADRWAVFYNLLWEWTQDGENIFWWGKYSFTYVNFDSRKKIYQDYRENFSCKVDKRTGNCLQWTKKTETSKEFFDLPKWDPNRKKLDLAAKNMEDAYFEYYKESNPGPVRETAGWSTWTNAFWKEGWIQELFRIGNVSTVSVSGSEYVMDVPNYGKQLTIDKTSVNTYDPNRSCPYYVCSFDVWEYAMQFTDYQEWKTLEEIAKNACDWSYEKVADFTNPTYACPDWIRWWESQILYSSFQKIWDATVGISFIGNIEKDTIRSIMKSVRKFSDGNPKTWKTNGVFYDTEYLYFHPMNDEWHKIKIEWSDLKRIGDTNYFSNGKQILYNWLPAYPIEKVVGNPKKTADITIIERDLIAIDETIFYRWRDQSQFRLKSSDIRMSKDGSYFTDSKRIFLLNTPGLTPVPWADLNSFKKISDELYEDKDFTYKLIYWHYGFDLEKGKKGDAVRWSASQSWSTDGVSFSDAQIRDILARIDENTKNQQEIAKNATGVLVQGEFRAEYVPSKDHMDDKVKIKTNGKERLVNLDEINTYNKTINSLYKKWVCNENNSDTHECTKTVFWHFYKFYKDWKYLWYTTWWYEVGSLTLINTNDWRKLISILDASDCHGYLNDLYLICHYYRGDGEIWVIRTTTGKEDKIWSNVDGYHLDDKFIYTKEEAILRIYSLGTLKEVFSKELP